MKSALADELEGVARAGLHSQSDGVAHLLDVGLGLAHAREKPPPGANAGGQRGGRPRAWAPPSRRAARRRRSSGSAPRCRAGHLKMRARSPSNEPPLRWTRGRQASTATDRSWPRQWAMRADSSDEGLGPGGRRVGRPPVQQRRGLLAPRRRAVLDQVQRAAGPAARSRSAQAGGRDPLPSAAHRPRTLKGERPTRG